MAYSCWEAGACRPWYSLTAPPIPSISTRSRSSRDGRDGVRLPLPISRPLPDGRGSYWSCGASIGAATVRERSPEANLPLWRCLENQRTLHIHLAELHGVAARVVVILPLILVVAGQHLAGLSDRDIQLRALPVAQVRVHAHRGSQRAGGLLHRPARSAHRQRSDIEVLAD